MTEFDVVGIGNAIVDILAHTDDAFLEAHDLTKGAMTLIDAEQATRLYGAMGPAVEISGGSAANTMTGIAALGGKAAFIGKVRDDQLGEVFAHDIKAAGVAFMTPPALEGLPTARSMILVTPDAQRTMNTFLGVAGALTKADINEPAIKAAHITYLEGYLWDAPEAKEAFRLAVQVAQGAGRQVALTLSDAFCVERFRAEFRALASDVDILFANEAELMSLYEVEDFDAGLQHIRATGTLAALTRSEKGSVIVRGDEIHVIDAEPDVKLVDTTGAGDQFAAGFLAGLAQNRPLAECGRMGSIAAAEVISHFGARPEADLKALVAERLG